MNERINRVLAKMEEKGLTQLLVSDPLSIRFLTGIMVNPGERLYALLLRSNGKHTLFLNYLYYVSDTGFEEVWFSDMDDQIGVLMEHIDTESVLEMCIRDRSCLFGLWEVLPFHAAGRRLRKVFQYIIMGNRQDDSSTCLEEANEEMCIRDRC